MKKRVFIFIMLLLLLASSTAAQSDCIKWVDFKVGYPALRQALDIDIASQGEEMPLDWVDILALAATRAGGDKVTVRAVNAAAKELRGDKSPAEFLGTNYKLFAYYQEAYGAVLGGLVGHYAIEKTDEESGLTVLVPAYGLKAFSPIAAGYYYTHYDDFGNSRNYGFSRRHLGNDLLGSLGTPIIAVESGTVEAMGWNQYGGWRIGIRSNDSKRYYYYAHLRKDSPYAEGLKEGDTVCAGDVIGFMGRTGYSTRENVNNIKTVHLHFGLQLVFDESQKECNNEIWIDVYDIVRLLATHRSSVQFNRETQQWERMYPYKDLDE
ncbi:MAG: M23 family metallopeptidase [Oscillospiraceae bacterium]|nr:M23 family metallopeptidase [Oscillospiraceae bacterium]